MGKETKVVIDNNVLVSAFGWHGKPEEVVRLATTGKITNFTTMEMLSELARAVGYPKLRFSESLQSGKLSKDGDRHFVMSDIFQPSVFSTSRRQPKHPNIKPSEGKG